MKKPDLLLALGPVVKALEEIGIPYYLGGSVCSSAYGIPRATLDIDIVADIHSSQVDEFVRVLKGEFYVDGEMMRRAIEDKSTFNIIHLDTMIKVDFFIPEGSPYEKEIFNRRRKEMIGDLDEFYFASPEDVILKKLDWYRRGGEISENQWKDVLGVLRVQGNVIDTGYLNSWASRLGLKDLLDKAITQAQEN